MIFPPWFATTMLLLRGISLVVFWLFAANFTLSAGPFQLLGHPVRICGSSSLGPVPPPHYNGWLNSLRRVFRLPEGHTLEMEGTRQITE
jgi:hypothetical protein